MPEDITFEEFVEVRQRLVFEPQFELMDRELEEIMEGVK